jgi:hypothetical protein
VPLREFGSSSRNYGCYAENASVLVIMTGASTVTDRVRSMLALQQPQRVHGGLPGRRKNAYSVTCKTCTEKKVRDLAVGAGYQPLVS